MRIFDHALTLALLLAPTSVLAREEAPGTVIQCRFSDQTQTDSQGVDVALLYRLYREDDGRLTYSVDTHDPNGVLQGASILDFNPGSDPATRVEFDFLFSSGGAPEQVLIIRSRTEREFRGPSQEVEILDGAVGATNSQSPRFNGPCTMFRSRDAVQVFDTLQSGEQEAL